MEERKYDLAVIGSGPGGYVAAIRAAQLGMSVCVIEKENIGGVCLNWGCIPTKALLKSAHLLKELRECAQYGISAENVKFDFKKCQERKNKVVDQLKKGVEFLLKKHSVDIIRARAEISGPNELRAGEEKIRFKNCIIASGSVPRELPSIKFDESTGIISSRRMLNLEAVPPRILIIGGGVIGCEFADMFADFGSRITIVEATAQVLPFEDEDLVRGLLMDFKKRGITVKTNTLVSRIEKIDDGSLKAFTEEGELGVFDKVLLSVGRRPCSEDCGIENAGISHDRGRIPVDDRMRTNVPGFYAIGDVCGNSFLAHSASQEGIIAAENISGAEKKMSYKNIPRCVYTSLEIAASGITEKEAKSASLDVSVGRFSFRACGKAVIENNVQGLVKIICDKSTGTVLGAALSGPSATEMIHELALAIERKMHYREIIELIHAHPTLSESIKEAAEAVDNLSIHGV